MIIERLENIFDRIRLEVSKMFDGLAEACSDAVWSLLEALGLLFGNVFVWVTDALVGKSPGPRGRLGGGAVKALGFLLILIVWVVLQVLISIFGLLAGIVGLRRGRNYSSFENLLSWFPLIVVALAYPWLRSNSFDLDQVTLLLSYAIIIQGLNIVTGVTGQVSLGHGVFVLVGGYVSAILYTRGFGCNPWSVFLVVPCGGLGAAVLGSVVGMPATRVKGPYLALLTLGLIEIAAPLLKSQLLIGLTGGSDGISIPHPNFGNSLRHLSQSQWFYLCTLMFFISLFYAAHIVIGRSKVGRALVTIREGEEKCEVLGVALAKYKMIAFGLGALYGGIGGGLITLSSGYISPESVSLKDSIDFLVALVIGGRGSLLGSVIGGWFLTYQSLLTNLLSKCINHGDQLLWGFYGSILIAVTIFAPKGVAGELRQRLFAFSFHLPARLSNKRNPSPNLTLEEEEATMSLIKYDENVSNLRL